MVGRRELRIFFKLFIYDYFCKSLEENDFKVCPGFGVICCYTTGSRVELLWRNYFVPWRLLFNRFKTSLNPPNMYIPHVGGDIAQLLLY